MLKGRGGSNRDYLYGRRRGLATVAREFDHIHGEILGYPRCQDEPCSISLN